MWCEALLPAVQNNSHDCMPRLTRASRAPQDQDESDKTTGAGVILWKRIGIRTGGSSVWGIGRVAIVEPDLGIGCQGDEVSRLAQPE